MRKVINSKLPFWLYKQKQKNWANISFFPLCKGENASPMYLKIWSLSLYILNRRQEIISVSFITIANLNQKQYTYYYFSVYKLPVGPKLYVPFSAQSNLFLEKQHNLRLSITLQIKRNKSYFTFICSKCFFKLHFEKWYGN